MQFVLRSSLYFLPAGLQMHVIKLSALAQKRRWALFDFNASGTYYFDNVALSEIDLIRFTCVGIDFTSCICHRGYC